MQRTFNYTGRKRIEQTEALFSFTGPDETPSFAVEFRIRESEYPKDASVYVEAHYKETRQRYYFGKVSKIIPPEDSSLTEVDLSGPTLFRVMIVDESAENGLLLASGENFRADIDPNEEKDRSSIITVVKKDLGQQTWTLAFETGGAPELCINSKIPNAIEKLRADPYFQGLILPAAFKQVLIFYLWNEDLGETEISKKWMEFAETYGEKMPDSNDPETLMSWVDDVVSEFSKEFNMCDRLLQGIKED